MRREQREGVGISGTESHFGRMTNGQVKTSPTNSKDCSFAIWEDRGLA